MLRSGNRAQGRRGPRRQPRAGEEWRARRGLPVRLVSCCKNSVSQSRSARRRTSLFTQSGRRAKFGLAQESQAFTGSSEGERATETSLALASVEGGTSAWPSSRSGDGFRRKAESANAVPREGTPGRGNCVIFHEWRGEAAFGLRRNSASVSCNGRERCRRGDGVSQVKVDERSSGEEPEAAQSVPPERSRAS